MMTEADVDIGFTHIALVCADAEKTIDFYKRFAGMTVVHDRTDRDGNKETRVFWLSDLKRPFAIVFLESTNTEVPLGPFGHLGVCCESREAVDALIAQARSEGRPVNGPNDWGPPVGYWAFIKDPDGHNLEVSYGQKLQITVEKARTM